MNDNIQWLENTAITEPQPEDSSLKINLRPLDQLVEIVSDLDFQRQLSEEVRNKVRTLLALITRVDGIRGITSEDKDRLLDEYYQELKMLVNR